MSSARDHHTTRPAAVRSRLAEARQRRAIAAADLAKTVGVSRQTIYAMENGEYVPNTAVALRLARALETPVEELFRLEEETPAPPREVTARLIAPREAFAGGPVELCRVGRQLVAAPAAPAMQQLLPADAVVANPRRSTVQLLNDEELEPRLLIAGCDPATSVLSRHLQKAGVGLVVASVNSTRALELLSEGLTHVAGTHLERAPKPAERSGFATFAFAVWEQGLVTARGNPKTIRGVSDLARHDIALVNREPGSGSRALLDQLLASGGLDAHAIHGYDRIAYGHLAAAYSVLSGDADVCLATRSAAKSFGLDFIPLHSERYDLVMRKSTAGLPAVEAFLDVLQRAALRRKLEVLAGYDTSETGTVVA